MAALGVGNGHAFTSHHEQLIRRCHFATRGPQPQLLATQVLELLREACERFVQAHRSEEHTSELQSLMRISYAVFCLKKKKPNTTTHTTQLNCTTHNPQT